MRILALDTCLNACSTALWQDGRALAVRREAMPRGQQERLAPMVAELMAEAGASFDGLDRIGVTVGPGSFTGLRVGLAFAKGLGLALDVPVVGVGTLEALAFGAPGLVAAALDARREQLYLQLFQDRAPLDAPEAVTLAQARARLQVAGPAATLIGSGAAMLARPGDRAVDCDGPDPAAIAQLAALAEPAAPRPIYLRAPDAKLPI